MAVNDTWPWTSETTAQGFLSGRWLRRAGDAYASDRQPPQVLSMHWTLSMPTEVGAFVGTCGYIGLATQWEIVAGNQDGYWAISPLGVVSVAAVGMFDSVIYEISVKASNSFGSSAATEMFISTVLGAEKTPYMYDPVVAGGEDENAEVSTSSGEPRSGAINPSRNLRPSISR